MTPALLISMSSGLSPQALTNAATVPRSERSSIPTLTRSALHRCLQRHGISRLPETDGDKPTRKRFKPYPIGYFHIDIAEVQTAEGKLYLFVGIDRTSKFAVTQLVDKADRRTAWEFLEHLLKAVPYRIHTILTDNGIQFAEQPRNRNTAWSRQMRFDMICEANGCQSARKRDPRSASNRDPLMRMRDYPSLRRREGVARPETQAGIVVRRFSGVACWL